MLGEAIDPQIPPAKGRYACMFFAAWQRGDSYASAYWGFRRVEQCPGIRPVSHEDCLSLGKDVPGSFLVGRRHPRRRDPVRHDEGTKRFNPSHRVRMSEERFAVLVEHLASIGTDEL